MKCAVRIRDWYSSWARFVSRSNSRSSWANAFTTRTPVTASSTTPATAPDRRWSFQLAGKTRLRNRTEMYANSGMKPMITRLRTGDSTTMTTIATISSVMLATSIGTEKKNCWINVRSAVERDITSPTDSSSCREKSSS